MSYFFNHGIRQIRTVVFAVLVAASSSLSADIIDNISETDSGSALIDDSLWHAQSFSFVNDVTLDQVSLLAFSVAEATGFRVQLFGDMSGEPGTLLSTLSGDDTPELSPPEQYIDLLNTALTGGETYWLVVSGDNATSDFGVRITNSTNVSGDGTLGTKFFTFNGGNTWNSNSGFFRTTISATSASAVPEPGVAAVMGLCVGMFTLRRRRGS